MSKKNDLQHECIMALKKQEHYGESKYEAKKAAKELAKERGEDFKNVQGIYSFSTMQSYEKNCKQFIAYCLKEHRADIKHYSDCRKYAEEYIQHEIDRGMSAWTIHTRASALCCSYSIRLHELDIMLPERKREDIVRSRGYNSSAYQDIDERYRDVKDFIRATGCRRGEVLALRKEDIKWSVNGKTCYIYKRGKGGVERWCLVNPNYNSLVKSMFDRSPHRINGENRLFKEKEIPVSSIHDLRANYAQDMYEIYSKHKMGNGERYHCRNERVGDSFDRGILERISYDLGHHRIDVVVSNYLYGMHGKN